MELESEDGSEIIIEAGSKRVIGRESGFCSDDRTVSRRHLSLEIEHTDGEPSASFEVLGQNPIWVSSRSGGDKRVFRKSSTGVMRVGDRVSLSLKKPIFFTLKKEGGGVEEEEKRILEAVEKREKRTLERREKEKQMAECIGFNNAEGDEELGFESFDVSQIDPVKEFGFLVMGQEFDQYSKQKIHNAKDWSWFLEGPRENTENEWVDLEEESKGNKHERRRKKKGEGSDDEDWTGESEDEKVFIKKLKGSKRPNYSMTRTTDEKKPSKYTLGSKKSTHQKDTRADEDEDDTLGGFIVNDVDPEGEEDDDEEEEGEEEEEEYDDDDDDDNGNGDNQEENEDRM